MQQSTQTNVIKKVLPNGLTVLFREDHSNPVVAVNAWFKVGSVNETDELNGLAHFQEHMVFKGTEKLGVGEIANLVKSAGGNLNAATSYSYTMYYIVLPSKSFSLALNIQADAMMNSTFDPEEFQKERRVVIEEARMYDDTPDSYAFYRTMELGFQVHNYRRPIAGYQHVVEKFTRDQLVDFYDRHYRPSNAVLVVVGDVDAGEAMREIEKAYGTWDPGQVDVFESPVEPEQEGFRYKNFRGAIDHAYIGAGFHVPSILDKDYPALEMLSAILGSGRSSRLYRRVREEKHLATTVSADLLAEKWPGFFMLFASTPADKWEDARHAIFEELSRFKSESVSEDELTKARRQIEKSLYSELETVEGQASNLGYYETLGDYRLAEQHRDAIRRVTPQEVMAVAQKYFRVNNCSMVSYLPEGAALKEPEENAIEVGLEKILGSAVGATSASATTSAAPDRAAAPRTVPAARSNDSAGEIRRLELDNGLRVLVKRRSTVPMVTMLSVAQGGIRLEPSGQSGLSVLGARALMKGTQSYDASQIVTAVEGLGGSIDTFSSFDVTGAYVTVLSEYLDDAAEIYKEVIRSPKFSADDVEKEKSRILKELAKRQDHPVYHAIDNLFANVFGSHPYAHPFFGNEDQLSKLTNDDCRSWYERVLTPGNNVLVFVGDITDDKAMALASNLFGDLAAAPSPTPELAAPTSVATPGVHELRRSNLKQAVGLVGFMAPPMMSKEAISLEVLNGIMTGLGGRLFVELRDKRSFGYMAGSSFMPLKERSIFYGYSNPGADNIEEALDVIMHELEKVGQHEVTDDELTRSKEWLVGSQTMKLQRNMAQAIEYGFYEALGFGYDTVEKAKDLIQKVTKQDIRDAASSVFTKDQAVLIKLLPEGEEAKAH